MKVLACKWPLYADCLEDSCHLGCGKATCDNIKDKNGNLHRHVLSVQVFPPLG